MKSSASSIHKGLLLGVVLTQSDSDASVMLLNTFINAIELNLYMLNSLSVLTRVLTVAQICQHFITVCIG